MRTPGVDGCEHCEHEGHGAYHRSHDRRYPRRPLWDDGKGTRVWIEDDERRSNGSTAGTLERAGQDPVTLDPDVVRALRWLMVGRWEAEDRYYQSRPSRGDD